MFRKAPNNANSLAFSTSLAEMYAEHGADNNTRKHYVDHGGEDSIYVYIYNYMCGCVQICLYIHIYVYIPVHICIDKQTGR